MLVSLDLSAGCVVFFFKQKTAYEMRISDWSSDVCSSDLAASATPRSLYRVAGRRRCARRDWPASPPRRGGRAGLQNRSCLHFFDPQPLVSQLRGAVLIDAVRLENALRQIRSEEHTSELQSLMRIPYAVFCLKKKTKP